VHQLGALEHPDGDLGVADVHGQQHGVRSFVQALWGSRR
jgi:hypothetical protein